MSADRINDGGPAFPEAGLSGLPNGEFVYGQPGMTLRDYFAAKAMQGFAADPNCRATADVTARTAYEWADAMLKARTS